MTREEYVKRMNEDEEWAPGWLAIDEEFEKLYPGQEPKHYGTNMMSRAMFGGEEYLDGYSIYESDNGYKHIVTYGMSNLYADEEAFGCDYNGWGYEMTMKLKEETAEDCIWALNMLGNLARYTYTSERFFEPNQYVAGNGTSLHLGVESMITGLICIEDTSLQPKDTVHGRLEFIQLVGVTTSEIEAIRKDINNIDVLVEMMKKDNPDFVTDMNRDFSYL